MPNYERDFFKLAQEFAEITTVTLDGKSELLNYVTYEKFTGSKPLFRKTLNWQIKYILTYYQHGRDTRYIN